MKRYSALVSIVLALQLSGCAWLQRTVTPDYVIDARTAGPLILDVCAQHDESVGRDPILVPAEREQALRSTELLRAMIQAAMESPVQ